jgi:hypothetical protein
VSADKNTAAREVAVEPMTAKRAAYFLRRFKADEKMLGPNEQLALDYCIELLTRQQGGEQEAVDDETARVRLSNDIHGVYGNTTKAMADHLWQLGYRLNTSKQAAASEGIDDPMIERALCAPYGSGNVSDMLLGGGDEEVAIMRAALTAALSNTSKQAAGEAVALEDAVMWDYNGMKISAVFDGNAVGLVISEGTRLAYIGKDMPIPTTPPRCPADDR